MTSIPPTGAMRRLEEVKKLLREALLSEHLTMYVEGRIRAALLKLEASTEGEGPELRIVARGKNHVDVMSESGCVGRLILSPQSAAYFNAKSRGGKARAASLTPERRQEIARAAAQKRWS